MNESKAVPFQIGLVMAGAVSAGAYTAGVIDFLMEALETWEKKKRAGDPDAPTHQVQIKVLTGASAGAITAAVFGSALRDQEYPFRKPSSLYQTWVDQVDISGLLSTGDLDKNPDVRSLLNSDFLESIADKELALAWNRTDWPAYLADPVEMYFTVTNLRGVPYAIHFQGDGQENEYGMSLHADYMHFALSPQANSPNRPQTALELGTEHNRDGLDGNWSIFKRSALSSGAFPVGLAPQILERTGTSAYDLRQWPISLEPSSDLNAPCVCTDYRQILPAWPQQIDKETWKYQFVNVDGGVANNEPFEIARRCLTGESGCNPRGAKEACRAVLMIDPFPDGPKLDPDYDAVKQSTLLKAIPTLLSAIVAQLRFKTEELELARDPEVYSRWMVAPRRYQTIDGKRQLAHYAIACGGLGGFGGFFARAFREHDYQLGRRNAQKFLRDTFVLHEDNSIFAESTWTADQKRDLGLMRDDGRYLPIIPLLGDYARGMPEPAWPAGAMTENRYRELTRQLQQRADKLISSLIKTAMSNWWERQIVQIGWRILKWRRKLLGKSIVDPIVDVIRKDLGQRGL